MSTAVAARRGQQQPVVTKSEAKERPILFSGPMVRAILNGSKTQTRRVIKPQPDCFWNDGTHPVNLPYRRDTDKVIKCPYGQVGERLWVRETWMHDPPHDGSWDDSTYTDGEIINFDCVPDRLKTPEHVMYQASQPDRNLRWRPSIHMFRWASRITLEITEVRAERLQDIRGGDAKAEGCEPDWEAFEEMTFEQEGWEEPDDVIEECEQECDWVNFGRRLVPSREHAEWERDRKEYALRLAFERLWKSINGDQSWTQNPWVWVVEFHRI